MEETTLIQEILNRQKSLVRWLMVGVFVLVTALIMPKYYRAHFTYEAGRNWTGPDMVAEFDFARYKTPAQIKEDKLKALQMVTPVFRLDEKAKPKAFQVVEKRFADFTKDVEAYAVSMLSATEEDKVKLREQMASKYFMDIDALMKESGSWEGWKIGFSGRIKTVVGLVYENYFADSSGLPAGSGRVAIRISNIETKIIDKSQLLSAQEMVESKLRKNGNFTDLEWRLVSRLFKDAFLPNCVFDASMTQKETDRALSRVSEYYGKVKAGDMIVARGQMVTAEIDNILQSYLLASREKYGHSPYWLTFIGQIALMAMITFMLVLYLRTNRPRIFYRNRKLAMVLLLYLIAIGSIVLAMKIKLNTWEEYKLNYAFIAPVCMVPLILTVFFDGRFGFFANIIIALVGGSIVPNGFEYFFVQMIGGTVAVYSLGRLRNRSSFFVSLSYILAAYAGAFIGYSFYVSSGFSSIHYGNLLLLLINVGGTFLTWLLIYIFEKIFGLTSDLTFIELLDTNHPLLKEMFMKAPGTFQHSLQVANIAEAVVNRIGGNSLKAKVGALFHDIGKIKNPHYFIENIQDDHNPHDDLSDEESARIIIQHVPDGVKLAREYNLPSEVVDFIRTHHGTSRTEFFYRHFMEENPDKKVVESDFQYPGPLPFTREMAVVMIADSIEAATRAMKEHSPEKMRELVINMVDSKVRQNQFINVNITFRDLEDIKQVIFLQLITIYHERVEYQD